MAQILYDPADKNRWDEFVTTYIVDYDSYAACIRCGYQGEEALEFAKQFMQEPYVRNAIKILEAHRTAKFLSEPEKGSAEESNYSELPPSYIPLSEEQEKQMIVSSLMREAHYTGPGASHAARVSALNALAKIKGIEKPEQEEDANLIRGGVMIVPAVGTLDDWEKAAGNQQAELKKTVRD